MYIGKKEKSLLIKYKGYIQSKPNLVNNAMYTNKTYSVHYSITNKVINTHVHTKSKA